jgi:hypothetical protein
MKTIPHSLDLNQLIERAYPEGHDLVALRYALYSEKHGDAFPADLREHIDGCSYCRQKAEIMKATDPILTGEWDRKVKVGVDSTTKAASAAVAGVAGFANGR